jgi:group I intron endonuclease
MKGVYKITNTVNGKFYIGSSKNIPTRIKQHFYQLKRNLHHSAHLQSAYNKYGKDSFIHEVLLECENFLEEEQKLLDNLDWSLSYNIGKTVGGGDNYTNNPNKEKIRLKLIETLKKVWANPVIRYGEDNFNWRGGVSSSICKGCGKKLKGDSDFCRPCYFSQRDFTGAKNSFFGKKHSKETIEKLKKKTNLPNSKKVMTNYGEYPSVQSAATALRVTRTTIINRIRNQNPQFSEYYFLEGTNDTEQS